MSFAKGEDVMRLVESLVKDLYSHIQSRWRLRSLDGQLYPSTTVTNSAQAQNYPDMAPADQQGEWSIPHISYQDAMAWYGSDKPDLRVPNKVRSSRVFRQTALLMLSRSNELSTFSQINLNP